MVRGVIGSVLLVAIAAIGATIFIYGEVEPCRVLAKEFEMRSEEKGDWLEVLGMDTEKLYRLETSQYSTGECTSMLVSSWRQRLEG